MISGLRLLAGALEAQRLRPDLGDEPTSQAQRFFGTLKYEHLFRGPVGDAGALAVEVGFRQIYNTIRPHQAIAGRTPRDAYLNGG